MHRVIGKRVVELSAAEFAALRERHTAVLLDVGTGDGKHVLHVARERPDLLVVGLDANADALRKTSAKAAKKAEAKRTAKATKKAVAKKTASKRARPAAKSAPKKPTRGKPKRR